MIPDTKRPFSSYTPDELIEFYKRDPAGFDAMAAETLEQACIARTPEQTLKNRRRQWAIEMQLRKAKTQLGRMQIMEGIFYGQVFGEDGQLDRLAATCTDLVRTISGNEPARDSRPKIRLLKR